MIHQMTQRGVDYAPLDRPVLSALTTRLKRFACSVGNAHRMRPEFGPFAASPGRTRKDMVDFATLVTSAEAPVATMQASEQPIYDLELRNVAKGVQMVSDMVNAPHGRFPFDVLTGEDADDIYRLAQICQPGPFAPKTHQLGTFIGLRRNGDLVGMAGQRLQLPGFTEISAVSVLPEYRGQGLGAELVQAMVHLIKAQGDIAFLHAYADNTAAIALYAKIGFRLRTHVQLRQYAQHAHASAA